MYMVVYVHVRQEKSNRYEENAYYYLHCIKFPWLCQICMIARDILVHVGEVFAWTKHLLCRTFQWDLVQVFCLRLGGVGWIIPGFRPDLCSGLRSGLRCRRRVWMNERRIHYHSWSWTRTVVVVVDWLNFIVIFP